MTALQLPGYRTLRVWQKAFELGMLIYELTDRFPPGNYRLSDQMRGAAISVFGNIAEGYTQGAIGSYIRHCEISRGSLGELIGYVHFCERVGLFKDEDAGRVNPLCNEVQHMLGSLIISLQKKRRSGTWDRSYGVKE
jgi:four helix bundle protein